MRDVVAKYLQTGKKIPPNIWWGVTVEDQRCADERIGSAMELAEMGCFVWVSNEPAIGFVDFTTWFPHVQWIVMGGMSGSKACCLDWFKETIQQRDRWVQGHADRHDVSIFMKQLGSHPYSADPNLFPGADLRQDGERWWFMTSGRHNGDIDKFPPCLQIRESP